MRYISRVGMKKITFFVGIAVVLVVATYMLLGVQSAKVESHNIPAGFNFIKISQGIEVSKLWHEGKLLDTIPVEKVNAKGELIYGVNLPALWSGSYKLEWKSPSKGLLGFLGFKQSTIYILSIGNSERVKSSAECFKYGPSAEGNACLAEYLPRRIVEVGAKNTRDEVVALSDEPLIWYCHGWLGGYAMGVLKQEGFEKALNSDYLTCKYTYLHYLVANEVLLNRDLESVIDYCIKDKFVGMDDKEAVFQCAHGVGFAGVASLRYEVDKMLDICKSFKEKINNAVTNCYEGVYRAKEMQSKSYHVFATEFRPISIDTSTFTTMYKPESCIGKDADYKFACYRYTMRGNTSESVYRKALDERVKYINNWRDNICRVDVTNACWYGLADTIFALLGNPPFWSMEYLPEEHWLAAIESCSLTNKSYNKTCIERLTHDHINKTLDKNKLTKWCSLLANNTDQVCSDASIDAYIKRFSTGKLYDPQAIKVEHEAEKNTN